MSDLTPSGLWSRITEIDEWRRQMTAELSHLPETIADLRETTAALRKLAVRLEKATAGIEVLIKAAESPGVTEMARRMEDAAALVEEQSRLGTTLAGAAIDELQRTVATANDLLSRITSTRRS